MGTQLNNSTASRGIDLAIEHATTRRDEQIKALVRVRQSLVNAEGQMGQLKSYVLEKDARFMDASQSGISATIMQHHIQFMQRLQGAISMQIGVISGIERQIAQVESALVMAERRLTTLKKVVERRERAFQKLEDKREQRQTDEFATLQFARSTQKQHGEIS